jgi:hypothetical protein
MNVMKMAGLSDSGEQGRPKLEHVRINGELFRSPSSKPQVIINRVPMQIIYTRHALRRFQRRLPQRISASDVLQQTGKFDGAGFALWADLGDPARVAAITSGYSPLFRYLCLAGYARGAIVQPRTFLVKTILVPGMHNTPEYAAARRRSWTHSELRKHSAMTGIQRRELRDYRHPRIPNAPTTGPRANGSTGRPRGQCAGESCRLCLQPCRPQAARRRRPGGSDGGLWLPSAVLPVLGRGVQNN